MYSVTRAPGSARAAVVLSDSGRAAVCALSDIEDWVVVEFEEPELECRQGEYMMDVGGGGGAGSETTPAKSICVPHTPPCNTETMFEVLAPTKTSDRKCEMFTWCGKREYEQTAATNSTDRVCMPFSDPDGCSPKEFQEVAPTRTSDRKCTPLRECNGTEYQSNKLATTRFRGNERARPRRATHLCLRSIRPQCFRYFKVSIGILF